MSVPPGQARELTFTSGALGTLLIGCRLTGPDEAGRQQPSPQLPERP